MANFRRRGLYRYSTTATTKVCLSDVKKKIQTFSDIRFLFLSFLTFRFKKVIVNSGIHQSITRYKEIFLSFFFQHLRDDSQHSLMATAINNARCATCAKDKSIVRCEGCLQSFCLNHLLEHRQQLTKQLDEIQMTRDLFRQTLIEHINNSHDHLLINEINRWQQDSIDLITKTAEEARQKVHKYLNRYSSEMEKKLNELTEQLRESRKENDFMERDLQQWNQQLTQMSEELVKPSNIKVKQSSTPLITKINVEIFSKSEYFIRLMRKSLFI